MIKYGISRETVEELIKLGICHDEERARELVSQGKADALIKVAKDSRPKEGTEAASRTEQEDG